MLVSFESPAVYALIDIQLDYICLNLLDRQNATPFLANRLSRRRRAQVVFLDDDTKLHRSKLTSKKIVDLGWGRVDHPPYSPDLAPSDFHLFLSLQHFLKGKRFEDIDEMGEALEKFFHTKDAEFYRRGIEKLPEKWEEVIEVDGEYFD